MDIEDTPYWKDYKGNAVRGVIAALCCAAFFVIVGLVAKFRWRPSPEMVIFMRLAILSASDQY